MTNNETTDIAVINDKIVRPADLSSVAEAMELFDKAKAQIIRKKVDVVSIQGKPYICKSGWRRLARAFTLNTEVISSNLNRGDDGLIISAEFIVRASHPNGAYSEAWGGCDNAERAFNKNQDIAAVAQTRSTNRAISDLIAGGEVSAEEMQGGYQQQRERPDTSWAKIPPKANPETQMRLRTTLFPELAVWPPKNEGDFPIGISDKQSEPISDAFRTKVRITFKDSGYGSDTDRRGLMAKLYSAFEIPMGLRHKTSHKEFSKGHGFFFMNVLEHPMFATKEADDPLPWNVIPADDVTLDADIDLEEEEDYLHD